MKNKKWSKLVQIGKNTEKAHTESTEIHRKNKFSHRKHRNTQKRSSHRKHRNTQKRSSHRKHRNTQKYSYAVVDVFSHTESTGKKLRRREVRGELTVWGDSGERDDVRWGWWGRVFHDGGGIVAPALGMTVGIEGAVGDVDDGVGVLAMEEEKHVGVVLGVEGRRYGR